MAEGKNSTNIGEQFHFIYFKCVQDKKLGEHKQRYKPYTEIMHQSLENSARSSLPNSHKQK